MRIEGTYTFAATSDRIFAALTQPEALTRLLPGCERLIQLGPTASGGAATFEARLQDSGAATATTITLAILSARSPAHLRIELRGHGAWGPFTASGSIDLVEQEEHARTIVAYALELVTPEQSAEQQRLAQQIAQRFCERVAGSLPAPTPVPVPTPTPAPVPTREFLPPAVALSETLADASEGIAFAVKTERGTIVALPPAAPTAVIAPSAWAQRLLWMGTGLLIGVSALALSAGLARWLTERDGSA